ncbi:MAG: cache domain-containing protein, partial [Sedimentibacter sp.]
MNSIKRKIFLNITAIILIVVIAIGGLSSYLCYKVTFDTLEQTMGEVAKASSNAVSKELDVYKSIASEIGLIPELSKTDITSEGKNAIFNGRTEMHGLKSINTANKEGYVISDSGNTQVVKHLDYFDKSINGEVFVTDALFDESTFEMYYIVSAPLWKDGIYGSSIDGVVILKVDGKTLSDIATDVVIGKEGFGTIIDKEGYTIGHHEYDKVLNLENIVKNYENDGSNKELALLEQKMLKGETNYGVYKNNGIKNLLSYAPIEGTDGWAILVEVPALEYMGTTNLSIIATVILGIISILIAAFMGFRMSNRISKPIIECADRLKLLSEGDLHTEVPKTKSKDETGLLLDSLEKTISNLNTIIQDISYQLGEIVNGDLTNFVDGDYSGDFKPIKDSVVLIIKSLNYLFRNINDSI